MTREVSARFIVFSFFSWQHVYKTIVSENAGQALPLIHPVTAYSGRYRETVALSGRKNFFGIEYALGVELALDAAHEIERDGIDGAVDVIALGHPDAMFAGQRSAELQHQIEHARQTGQGVAFLLRILRIIEQVHVDVAVTGVAKIDDRDAVFARQLFEAVDQIGNTRDRHDHVFVEFVGGDGAQRRGQRFARGPQRRRFLLVLGRREV